MAAVADGRDIILRVRHNTQRNRCFLDPNSDSNISQEEEEEEEEEEGEWTVSSVSRRKRAMTKASNGIRMKKTTFSDHEEDGCITPNMPSRGGKERIKVVASSHQTPTSCHQCKNRRDLNSLVSCSNCTKKRYCIRCIHRRYPLMSEDSVRQACPSCLGICKQHQKPPSHKRPPPPAANPVHDEAFYLTIEHKRRLKEEYGVEPWTFVQRLGEAVFIPAGCPHQVRNIVSCTKVALDFVSPENVQECIRLTEDFRVLPEHHRRKQDKLEVKKLIVHAVNHAMKTLQELIPC